MIGDSQWIGGAAENGHYIKLNDFFAKEGIDMGDFIPRQSLVTLRAEGDTQLLALPAFGDVVGWTYRKDWFERPELRKEYKAKYGRDLDVPNNLDELKDIAQFFQKKKSMAKRSMEVIYRAIRRDHDGCH